MQNIRQPIIKLTNIYKEFDIDDAQVEVLKNINLEIYPGEFVVIFGHSGCGKSTLLNTVTGLERPTRGNVEVCGTDLYKFNEDGRAKFRQNNFGLVLQQPNWIKSLNVIENVAYSLQITGETKDDAILAATDMINQMGMGKYLHHAPNKLSGGQQQKIAMCRAILTKPRILVADEPTGNLDTASGIEIMKILQSINKESGRTILMVSHNPEYEKYASKVIHMKDGVIEKVIVKDDVSGIISNNDGLSLRHNNRSRHMKMTYIISLALKSLFGHKMRTLLTASGIAISVGFIMFLLSLGMGLQKISVNQVANIDAMQILDVSPSKSKLLKIDDAMIKRIKTIGNVQTVQPQVSSVSKFKYNKSEIEGVIYGEDVDYLKMDEVKILDGRKYSSNTANEVIISKAAQEQLSSESMVSKEVSFNIIVLPNLLSTGQSTKQFTKTMKVIGISDEKESVVAYSPIGIFAENGIVNYSNIKVKINSKEAVTQAGAEIESLGLKFNSIKETVDQINKFFGIFQLILAFGGSIAIIVACIGMFNTLTITLIEKTKEIGFMKIIGTVKRDIYSLFVLESIIIGLFGSTIGVIVSYSVGKIINYIIGNIAISSGNEAVELFYTPLYIIFFVLAASFIISAFTSYYPARRAAKIKPLDALRYE